MAERSVLLQKEEVLQSRFGFTEFRPGQAQIVDTILSRRDCLAVLSTGAGKSICFQIPALMFAGMTYVISPLVSLMEDQVAHLRQKGIPAIALHSSMSKNLYYQTLYEAMQGGYKLLYLAPERLQNTEFLRFAQRNPPPLLVIDEAHCVSQWGHDFRPSYLRIAEFVAQLPHRPVLAAFTATATMRVRQDMTRHLALQEPFVMVKGFNRPNLYFAKASPANKERAILNALEKLRGQSGIIYCATHKGVERVTQMLRERGLEAARYHGGLTAGERTYTRQAFVGDAIRIVVATSAFGMGIDKADVSFILHYNMPQSLEEYFQEAGRAGRNGEPAYCLLLYSKEDLQTQKALLRKQGAVQRSRRKGSFDAVRRNGQGGSLATVWKGEEKNPFNTASGSDELLLRMWEYCHYTGCLRRYILNYFGESGEANETDCGYCSNCKRENDRATNIFQRFLGRKAGNH